MLWPDLASHIATWSTCTRCPLGHDVAHVLFEAYPEGARLEQCVGGVLVLGEAPGLSEATLHRPFIGPAGRLLRQALDDCPVTPCILLTNTLCCRPCSIGGTKAGVRAPTLGEREACLPRLADLVRIFQPRAAVLLRWTAHDQWGLLLKDWSPLAENIVEYQLVHPSAALRLNSRIRFGELWANTADKINDQFERNEDV